MMKRFLPLALLAVIFLLSSSVNAETVKRKKVNRTQKVKKVSGDRAKDLAPKSSNSPFRGETLPQNFNLSAMVGPYWFFGFGYQVGGRAAFRIVNRGFIPMLNNSVFIEAGLFYQRATMDYGWLGAPLEIVYSGIRIPVVMRWDFQLNKSWIFYAAAGVGISFGKTTAEYKSGGKVYDYESKVSTPKTFGVSGDVGAIYNFSENLGVRLEVGSLGGIVGVLGRF
jgi:opacity protein-like surface antigen